MRNHPSPAPRTAARTCTTDADRRFDVVVIGAGHAGCEAALAVSRMGGRVAVATLSREKIAEMPCNPAIGGLAKSHLVVELDALGGAMGRVIDRTGIQFRLLNRGKGPAVRAPRAQADKHRYKRAMRRVLERAPGLELVEAEVTRILFEGARVSGVALAGGDVLRCGAVVITTGTFLYGLMHIGERTIAGGRRDEQRTTELSDCIRGLGLRLARFKTGTPPRLAKRTIDYGGLTEQPGEVPAPRFSRFTPPIDRPQISCWITRTGERTLEIIRENIDRSPLYSGRIQGIGPRYCPSIEDKAVRFPDKPSHQIFLEPEGLDVEEVYVNGLSTSMPEPVQEAMIRSIPGLARAEILRYGYAVEYDCILPVQLSRTLMVDAHPGLFFAGQINGTSGYEEAAAQGLAGGVNALCHVRGEAPFLPGRADGYIGVLIDDLVTRGTEEPYRMFTSQAEYRLLLRCDNAGDRFVEAARRLGLLDGAEADLLAQERDAAAAARAHLARTPVPRETLAALEARHPEAAPLAGRVGSWEALLRRRGISLADLPPTGGPHLAELLSQLGPFPGADAERVGEKIEIEIAYSGYVARMLGEIARRRAIEGRAIPAGLFDRMPLTGLSSEAAEKLVAVRPETFGQAERIAGVTPSDVSVLLVHAERLERLAAAS